MANILLVEDDETISFGIRSALAKKGSRIGYGGRENLVLGEI